MAGDAVQNRFAGVRFFEIIINTGSECRNCPCFRAELGDQNDRNDAVLATYCRGCLKSVVVGCICGTNDYQIRLFAFEMSGDIGVVRGFGETIWF